MKSSITSSACSSRTPPAAATSFSGGGGIDRSEARSDINCYYPGCRKDTNCSCKMCLESINATLDLIPSGSSITKLSHRSKMAKTPPSPTVMEPTTPPATPGTNLPTSSLSFTPPIESTAKSLPRKCRISSNGERFWVLGHWRMVALLGLFFFTAVGLRSLAGVMEGPRLSKDVLERFGKEYGGEGMSLRGMLRLLELKIGGIVHGEVLNCSSLSTAWEMNQVGPQFFHWRCVIYKSMAEEVSVWGSPLPTSGLISTGFYSRSLTLLLGRITEWSDGRLEATSRTENGSSWTLQQWMTVAVRLEINTWIVEYKRTLFEDLRSLPAASKALISRSMKMLKLAKQEPWRFLSLGSISSAFYQNKKDDMSPS